MKILHIIAGAEKGGAETFCCDALKALSDAGIQQHVLCRPHPDFVKALDNKRITHKDLTFNRFLKPFEQSKIKREIEAFNPDVVHCWMSRASSFAPKTAKPTLGWFGGYYDLKNYKNCQFYMGVTKDIVAHIIRETNAPERSYVVHTFGTLEEDKPVNRADFDIPQDAKLVLLLSRMHWKKGIDTLLEAAKDMNDNVYFLLAGDGPDLEKFKKMAKDMGLEKRVRFPGWRNDRAALLKIADVCVLPSRYEPFGTVIAESWFAQTPLVATKAAGAKQYVTHKSDGLLCEIDDSKELAKQLTRALDDENLRQTLVENGLKTYNALFSKDVVTRDLRAAYEDILKKHKAA